MAQSRVDRDAATVDDRTAIALESRRQDQGSASDSQPPPEHSADNADPSAPEACGDWFDANAPANGPGSDTADDAEACTVTTDASKDVASFALVGDWALIECIETLAAFGLAYADACSDRVARRLVSDVIAQAKRRAAEDNARAFGEGLESGNAASRLAIVRDEIEQRADALDRLRAAYRAMEHKAHGRLVGQWLAGNLPGSATRH